MFLYSLLIGSLKPFTGNSLANLDKLEIGSDGKQYPNLEICKGIVLFDFDKMIHISSISDEDAMFLSSKTLSNYSN